MSENGGWAREANWMENDNTSESEFGWIHNQQTWYLAVSENGSPIELPFETEENDQPSNFEDHNMP